MLLHRLAVEGGCSTGGFLASDKSVRAGAAWICHFAMSNHAEAAALLGKGNTSKKDTFADRDASNKSDLKRRSHEARECAMRQMPTWRNLTTG